MSSQVIEYITGVQEKDIVGRNVIPGKDINGRATILIKSTQEMISLFSCRFIQSLPFEICHDPISQEYWLRTS